MLLKSDDPIFQEAREIMERGNELRVFLFEDYVKQLTIRKAIDACESDGDLMLVGWSIGLRGKEARYD